MLRKVFTGNEKGSKRTTATMSARSIVRTELAYEPLERRAVLSTFIVQNLADSGPGSLREAIATANEQAGADVIRFRAGLQGTIALTTGQLEITDPLRIQGPGEARLTISGNLMSRVFRVDNTEGDVVLRGFTIADGRARELEDVGIQVIRGGGILNLHGLLRLNEITFRNNRAEDVGEFSPADVVGGGAIANSEYAMLRMMNCTFTGNSASGGTRYAFGGAIASVTESQAYIRGSRFENNFVADGVQNFGGAVATFGGSVAGFVNSQFVGNRASGTDETNAFGGALAARPGTVDNSPSELLAIRCLFSENSAEAGAGAQAGGGAIYNAGSVFVLQQSDLIANWAAAGDVSGGGLLSKQGIGFIHHSKLLSNQAIGLVSEAGANTARGGGLASIGGGWLTISHTDVLLNEARAARAFGGGIFNGEVTGEDMAMLFIHQSQINENRAVATTTDSQATAYGGGVFNGNVDSPEAPGAIAMATRTKIDRNSALASESGSGIGGGIYNNGSFSVDRRLERRLLDGLAANFASTSHSDVFGDLTVI